MLIGAAPQPFAPPTDGKIVIYRGATLIDGTGGPARPNMAIVVRDETIREVLPAEKLTFDLLRGADVVGLEGQYILPGLIDSHAHFAIPPNRKFAEGEMRRAVYSGITAMRDMADDLRVVADLTRASRVGEIPGPDLYYAALMAGPGFFNDWRMMIAAQGEEAGQVPWMQAITNKTNMPLAIAMARGTSATGIKIYADLPAHLIKKIADEAHRQGLKVWAHGTVFPSAPSAGIAAGVDSVSHVCSLGYEVSDVRPQSFQQRFPVDQQKLENGGYGKMAALFRQMRARGIILDATFRGYVKNPRPKDSTPPNPMQAARAAKARNEKLDTKQEQMSRPPSCSEEVATRLTALAYKEGVEIAAGTDFYTRWRDPYTSLHEEIVALGEKVGMPPAQVIRSATLVGAMSIGQEKTMGTIEPGKLANMVIVAKDPLADLNNLRGVVMTVKRGRRFHRADYPPLREDEATAAW